MNNNVQIMLLLVELGYFSFHDDGFVIAHDNATAYGPLYGPDGIKESQILTVHDCRCSITLKMTFVELDQVKALI